MRYKARRKEEIKAREEAPEARKMSEPAPIKRAEGPLEDRVPIRMTNQTVKHIRVSKLQLHAERYARDLGITVTALHALIAARRYTPEPVQPRELRQPSWYISDHFSFGQTGAGF